MNLTRIYTLALGSEVSVGRVQTPTLAMIVDRDQAIDALLAEEYGEVQVTFCTASGATYPGKLVGRDAAETCEPTQG